MPGRGRGGLRGLAEWAKFHYTKRMQAPTSFLLVAKARHKKAFETAGHMAAWLEERGLRAVTLMANVRPESLEEAAAGADAVVVLGGDGTLVGVARKLAGHGLPLLGINFGQVGFLAEVPAAHWQEALGALVDGTAQILPRVLIKWAILRDGCEAHTGWAVNDIVVGRGSLARVLAVRVCVDGELMGWVRADGMIVATPLGTSGYVLSAGGSLIHPGMQAMSITAISPFLNSFPSMVLSADNTLSLEVDPAGVDAFLTVDGQDGLPLVRGDVVQVRCMAEGLRLVVPDGRAYFRRLRDCGFIQEYQPIRQRTQRGQTKAPMVRGSATNDREQA